MVGSIWSFKCSTEFINTVLEPACIKKLYSDMFQTSEKQTDDLLYEGTVLSSESDLGISFEEALKSLRKNLDSCSESNLGNTEEKKIALALFDFSGGRKNQLPFRRRGLYYFQFLASHDAQTLCE